ncbi:hypothetical protein LT493_02130 [Streptomyces tricolor]|nr:hypothetical protein [Streptomyces tricolor]
MRAGIRAWLDGDSRRRLLILLDECDQFFEADAPRFDQTKKLKGPRLRHQGPGQGRLRRPALGAAVLQAPRATDRSGISPRPRR